MAARCGSRGEGREREGRGKGVGRTETKYKRPSQKMLVSTKKNARICERRRRTPIIKARGDESCIEEQTLEHRTAKERATRAARVRMCAH